MNMLVEAELVVVEEVVVRVVEAKVTVVCALTGARFALPVPRSTICEPETLITLSVTML